MGLLQIPPEKRVPLPAPDYNRMLAHAAESASLTRFMAGMRFKAKRADKLARREFRRMPGWKRHLANLVRAGAADRWAAAMSAQPKVEGKSTEPPAESPVIPWEEIL